jgi:transcriptional regulator with XRE-family HTH domain
MAAARHRTSKAEGADYAAQFGSLIRERREALGITQDNLALSTGVGRRFLIELEAGKASAQLGKALIVAVAVGLRPFEVMTENRDDNALLPDLVEDTEEPPRG